MKTNKLKIFHPRLFEESITEHYALIGFTVHRGVIIGLLEHVDDRVFGVIDLLPGFVVDKIVAAIAREGCIVIIWKGHAPRGYETGCSVYAKDGDAWIIEGRESYET